MVNVVSVCLLQSRNKHASQHQQCLSWHRSNVMPTIFISYRREDSAADAGRIAERIRESIGKDNVFIDVDTIRGGDDFVTAIEDAVGKCDTLFVIIGRQWLTATNSDGKRRLDDETDYVRFEIRACLKRKIRVVPVLVQGVSIPRAKDLPSDLMDLIRRNAVEIRETSFKRDVDALLEDVTGKSSSADGSRFKQPFVWMGVGVSVVIAAYLFLTFGKTPVPNPVGSGPQSADFWLKLNIRLSEEFGPVDRPRVFDLWHKKPKDYGINLLKNGEATPKPGEFEYKSPFIMPSRTERYEGWLTVDEQHSEKKET